MCLQLASENALEHQHMEPVLLLIHLRQNMLIGLHKHME